MCIDPDKGIVMISFDLEKFSNERSNTIMKSAVVTKE